MLESILAFRDMKTRSETEGEHGTNSNTQHSFCFKHWLISKIGLLILNPRNTEAK